MTLAESIEESLGNNEQSDQAIIEIRDELRALTDIVDSYKSYTLNYNDNMKDFLLSLSEKVKDIYNINWFASESVTEKLTSIDESLTVSNEMKNSFLEEVRQPERAEDYLNEQRENTKMYQSKLTNKLLGDLLKEVKNMGVGGITRDTDREGFLSKALGGLGSSLVGGAAAALGLGKGLKTASKAKKGLKGLKTLSKIVKVGRLGLGATGVGLLGLAVDEYFGITDFLLDSAYEAYTGTKRQAEETKKKTNPIVKLRAQYENMIEKTPDWFQETLSYSPVVKFNKWMWGEIAEATGESMESVKEKLKETNDTQEDALMGKMMNINLGGITDFFKNNDLKDMLRTMYTDPKKFEGMMDELSGSLLGEQIDKVTEMSKTADTSKDDTSELSDKSREQKDKVFDELLIESATKYGLEPNFMKAMLDEMRGSTDKVTEKDKVFDELLIESATKYGLEPNFMKAMLDELSGPIDKVTEISKTTDTSKDDTSELSDKSREGRVKVKPRRTYFDEMIIESATKYGLEPNFVKAMIMAESNFHHDAVSEAGAYGLTQMREIAAKDVGADWERVKGDPEYNIEMGTKYLAKMMERFGRDKRLALSGYNAGPTATARQGGVAKNPETQKYVTDVLGYEEQLNRRQQEQLKAQREQQRTDVLRDMSVNDNQPNETANTNIINTVTDNSSGSDEGYNNLTKLNADSPFDLTYAKLMFNKNYSFV